MSIITCKEIIDLVKKGATSEAQEKIMELRAELLLYREENQKLKKEIERLSNELDIKQKLVFRNGVYWLKKDDGSKDGPFCIICYDDKNRLIRLTSKKAAYMNPWWECQKCKAIYKK